MDHFTVIGHSLILFDSISDEVDEINISRVWMSEAQLHVERDCLGEVSQQSGMVMF